MQNQIFTMNQMQSFDIFTTTSTYSFIVNIPK